MATTSGVEVVMPQMGVSVSEGTITKWLKNVGDPVEADESLLEISTDKVDTEVPSPGSGVLQEILVQEGETVEVGTKLATIGPEGGAPPAPAGARARSRRPQQAARESEAPSSAETPTARGSRTAQPAQADGASQRQDVRLAGRREDRVGARRRPGAGARHRPRRPRHEEGHPRVHRGRRPRRARRGACRGSGSAGRAAGAAAAGRDRSDAASAQPQPAAAQPGETLEPMNAMRRGIADHMRRSLDTAAHVTSAIEVDMSKVVAIRAKLKKQFQDDYGVNPTYLAFVSRAVVETLREYPWINGEIRGDQIVTRKYVNLGFAVELADGKGLIVPVLKNAEGLNLLGIARGVTDLAQRARDKKLLPDDVQGGTFTITNPGGYGTFHGTPIISQPQAGILGTYAVVKRPWVVQDEHGQDVIAIRPIMNLTLTYDHRLVDGALAGRFLRDLRQKLESWGESEY